MQTIYQMQVQSNGTHEALKKEMRYKFPGERIQEKISKMIEQK